MMPTRICRDCQWHDPETLGCLHERAEDQDCVTGAIARLTCYQMRIWPCGAEGKFWTPFPDSLENDPVDMTKEPF